MSGATVLLGASRYGQEGFGVKFIVLFLGLLLRNDGRELAYT